jgi:hypothetical protein
MEPTHLAPLSPEQIAAIDAGNGIAWCEDPTTHVQYQLIKCDQPPIGDEYVREKIAEGDADAAKNGFVPLDMARIKRELQRRLEGKGRS